MYSQLQDWLTQNVPEIDFGLNAGASEAELDQFANQIGTDLPTDFQEMYRWHNGQNLKVATGLFYGLPFLPLEASLRSWKAWSDLIDSETDEGLKSLGSLAKSALPRTVKPVYANKLWIPFAHDWSGNHLGLDLDPDEAGTRGQVINFGRDEDTKYVIASDLSSFIRWMLRELESGNFFIDDEDDGGRSFNTLHPRTQHFLDSIPMIFGE